MKIIVNGESAEVEAATLAGALEELGYGEALVATALNREFVPAPLRGETRLSENDRIEIIAPMQGG
ncbi:sulfur carrier protein ThiS [Fulvimarina endophytica]|uniref:Sulfur carrier protein ThiS n=1 Tax=Fulvimarina endophytica TaxID=2293836 RepID=A0A371X5A1_9HYPH|nr:sulfur carrier protein ThiS [Fulvimarina endophytica]RFC64377.1 sulfur carrier protein ThiS [Fulvimarina endophytica]